MTRECTLRNKQIVVDERPYRVWLTANCHYQPDYVSLRLLVRPKFGAGSMLTFEGLRNFTRYHPYRYWEQPDFCEETDTIAVTPRVIATLIRHALSSGWNPQWVRATKRLEVTNVQVKTLLKQSDSAACIKS